MQIGSIRLSRLLFAIVTCIAFAVFGQLLTGDALETWYPTLNQPWFSFPLWGWYIVGVFYYIISISILYRLFSLPQSVNRNLALLLTIAMLSGNEAWNYLFFVLESTYLAFISLIPFTLLVLFLFLKLNNLDKKASFILLPYLMWIGYDLFWTYYLWKLN